MEQSIFHVKKKDLVQVISGKEKGKTGKILRVSHKSGKVVVEKLHMIKRHTKATGKTAAGIVEREGAIAACKVLLFCEKCNKGVRTHRKVLESGKKIRVCSKCESELDK
jgi:large subunit ribosomal protein L24